MEEKLVKEIKEKMSKVYNTLLEPYDKEVTFVIEQLSPMFVSKNSDEIIRLGKKMLELRKLANN